MFVKTFMHKDDGNSSLEKRIDRPGLRQDGCVRYYLTSVNFGLILRKLATGAVA